LKGKQVQHMIKRKLIQEILELRGNIWNVDNLIKNDNLFTYEPNSRSWMLSEVKETVAIMEP